MSQSRYDASGKLRQDFNAHLDDFTNVNNAIDTNISIIKGANVYLSDALTEQQHKDKILAAKNCGIEKIIFMINYQQTTYTDNTFAYKYPNSETLLLSLVNYCKSIGLEPIIKLAVYSNDQGSKIQPSDTNAWFANYKTVCLKYAQFCQDNGIAYFGIANELIYITNGNRDKWTDIINSIKAIKPSLKVFISNNTLTHKICVIYDLVDIIGFNFYPSLTRLGSAETTTNLRKAMYYDLNGDDYFAILNSLKDTYGKELWVSEIGMAAIDPQSLQDTWYNGAGVTNEAVRTTYYQMMFDMVYKNSGAIDGMFIWNITDGYSFLGKAAQTVVESYWGGGV